MLCFVHIFIEISTEYKYFLHRPVNLIPSGLQNALSVACSLCFSLSYWSQCCASFIHWKVLVALWIPSGLISSNFQSPYSGTGRLWFLFVRTVMLHMLKAMRVKRNAAELWVSIDDLAYRIAQWRNYCCCYCCFLCRSLEEELPISHHRQLPTVTQFP